MSAKLSTHVLDTAHGSPAEGMLIELWFLSGDQRRLLKSLRTNADGRTEHPLLAGEEVKTGQYELVFWVGEYFSGKVRSLPKTPFLDRVPVRFGIGEPAASYHVPLLCSPWGYTTYRGS